MPENQEQVERSDKRGRGREGCWRRSRVDGLVPVMGVSC